MSNLNLNKVILCGRLTADVELKQTPSGVAVCSFTLAVNRRYQKNADGTPAAVQSDFISCVAWRQTAEFITRYFRKGSPLCVVGSIQTRSWQDQQGNKRFATEVIVDEAMFVESKDSQTDAGAVPSGLAAPGSAVPPAIDTLTVPSFETDDDVPF